MNELEPAACCRRQLGASAYATGTGDSLLGVPLMCRIPYTPAANAASRVALALESRCHSSAPRFCVYTCAQRRAALILMMADIIYVSPCMIEWRPSWCVCSCGGSIPARNIHRRGSWRGCGQDATGSLEKKHHLWSRNEAEMPD